MQMKVGGDSESQGRNAAAGAALGSGEGNLGLPYFMRATASFGASERMVR